MPKILFDSDVIIEYLRKNEKVVDAIEALMLSDSTLAIAPVTEAEIRRGLRSHERQKTEKTLSAFECLVTDRRVGKQAGDYLRTYTRSHGLEIPDALVAATGFVYNFSLCTFNWKHYPMQDLQQYRMER